MNPVCTPFEQCNPGEGYQEPREHGTVLLKPFFNVFHGGTNYKQATYTERAGFETADSPTEINHTNVPLGV